LLTRRLMATNSCRSGDRTLPGETGTRPKQSRESKAYPVVRLRSYGTRVFEGVRRVASKDSIPLKNSQLFERCEKMIVRSKNDALKTPVDAFLLCSRGDLIPSKYRIFQAPGFFSGIKIQDSITQNSSVS